MWKNINVHKRKKFNKIKNKSAKEKYKFGSFAKRATMNENFIRDRKKNKAKVRKSK